jgi:hypothetical protein
LAQKTNFHMRDSQRASVSQVATRPIAFENKRSWGPASGKVQSVEWLYTQRFLSVHTRMS